MASPKNNIKPEVRNTLIKNIKYFEGYEPKTYKDSQGIPTVGYGINLNDPSNLEFIRKNTPYKIDQVLKGKVNFSEKYADKFINNKLNNVYREAKNLHPNLDNYPAQIQNVIMDLDYNMGPTKLAQFKKFNNALQKGNYLNAAEELKNSNYYNQTGRRAKTHYDTLSTLGLKASKTPVESEEDSKFSGFMDYLGNSYQALSTLPVNLMSPAASFQLLQFGSQPHQHGGEIHPAYRMGGKLTKQGKKVRKYGPRPDYMNQNPSGMTTGPITQRSIGNTSGGGFMSFGDGGSTAYKAWFKYNTPEGREGLPEEYSSYDYQRYYNDAVKGLNPMEFDEESQHFPDTYKYPWHPSFSDESIYYINQKETPALSYNTKADWKEYLRSKKADGGWVYPTNTGYPKYADGGWTGYPDHTMYSSGMERFDRVRNYTKYDDGGETNETSKSVIYVNDPNDFKLKTYQDSLYNYNVGKSINSILSNDENLVKVNPNSKYAKTVNLRIKSNNNNLIDNTQIDSGNYPNYKKVGAIMKEFQQKGNKSILPVNYQNYILNPDNEVVDLVTARPVLDWLGVTPVRPPGAAILPEWKKPEVSVIYDPKKYAESQKLNQLKEIKSTKKFTNPPSKNITQPSIFKDEVTKDTTISSESPKNSKNFVEYIWTPYGKMLKSDYQKNFGTKPTERDLQNKKAKGGPVTWSIIEDRPMAQDGLLVPPAGMFDTGVQRSDATRTNIPQSVQNTIAAKQFQSDLRNPRVTEEQFKSRHGISREQYRNRPSAFDVGMNQVWQGAKEPFKFIGADPDLIRENPSVGIPQALTGALAAELPVDEIGLAAYNMGTAGLRSAGKALGTESGLLSRMKGYKPIETPKINNNFNLQLKDLSEGRNIKHEYFDQLGNKVATFSGTKSPEGIYANAIEVFPEFRRKGVASDIYKQIAKNLQSKNEGTLLSRSTQHQFTDVDELGRSIAPASKLWENLVDKGEAEKFVEGLSHTYKIKPIETSSVGNSSISTSQQLSFPNPLATADKIIPRPFTPLQLLGMNDSWNYYSPLNIIPGYGKKLSANATYPEFVGFRKFGNSIDDVIENQALRPKGSGMGAEQIKGEGNWAEPNKPNEHYPGVFEATMNPQIEGSNIKLEKWNKRNGIVGTTKEGDVAIPLTDPGLSFNRRLPFSNRYVPIDKQKLINNKFQLATIAPHLQSLLEKYGLYLGGAGTLGYLQNGKEGAKEKIKALNKYTIDPVINWTQKQYKDFKKETGIDLKSVLKTVTTVKQKKQGGRVTWQIID